MGRLLLLVILAVSATGCVAMGGGGGTLDPMDATPRTYDYDKGTLAKIGEGILSVPETIVWWPYKIATSAVRGGYDGVAGGVTRAEMPIIGVIASPFTAAGGIVNGTMRGIVRGPAYIGSVDEFGRSLGRTWTEPIPLWKDGK